VPDLNFLARGGVDRTDRWPRRRTINIFGTVTEAEWHDRRETESRRRDQDMSARWFGSRGELTAHSLCLLWRNIAVLMTMLVLSRTDRLLPTERRKIRRRF
jgi:hypothetical protein